MKTEIKRSQYNKYLKTKITVDLTNVTREEQEELRAYLEANCWKWEEKTN